MLWRESDPRRRSWRSFDSCRRDCVVDCKSVSYKSGSRQPFRGWTEKNQRRARHRATTARLRFMSASIMMRCLFMCHFAPRHLGAAIWRLDYSSHIRFGHFRTEKGSETDNQQSAQPDSAHDAEM